ncbi:MAG TPA: zf-HC2 domain-containing protein [Burkholderiales bacterium]|nr:zf-HC2 domain-containing protein [Burkholderiales bacterium]
MKERPEPQCPRTEALSALIDEELAGGARSEMVTHAASCPLCGAMLADLQRLRVALKPLAAARPGVDLAPLIEQRLRDKGVPSDSSHRPSRVARPRSPWTLFPVAITAAGALALGVYFGALLAGGGTASMLRPASMALFDPIPPGGLCVGLPACDGR